MARRGTMWTLPRIVIWDGYCFAAELTRDAGGDLRRVSGYHDPNVALSRAITEAAQSRITAISGAREDLPSAIYHRFGRVHTYAKARKTSLRLNRARPTPWRVPVAARVEWRRRRRPVANRSGTEAAGGRVRLRRCLCPRGEGARPRPHACCRAHRRCAHPYRRLNDGLRQLSSPLGHD